jgi:hypothetical protein
MAKYSSIGFIGLGVLGAAPVSVALAVSEQRA